MMEWHIVTGSKGGVGKTLLSLLLLAHCLEEKQQEKGSTLILDLNGMNTDSSALLLYRNNVGQQQTTISLETKETLYHQGANFIKLQTVDTHDIDGKIQKYAVGWPQNPFALMNPQLFADLLSAVTLNVTQIEEELKFIYPLRHIIIDTNYHFCNIFAQNTESPCYAAYQSEGALRGEEINIWFLWVYRQLEKLLDDCNEAMTIRTTATTLEKILTGSYGQTPPEHRTPLIHVFTPVGLMTSPSDTGILARLFGAQKSDSDHIISEFAKLEDQNLIAEQPCIQFENWVLALNNAYNSPKITNKNQERASLFPEVLLAAVEGMGNQRPRNVIPVSVYEDSLRSYTNRKRADPVAGLRSMRIYHHLSTLLK